VIPGYLPLKLNITESMTSGADFAGYVSHMYQAVNDDSVYYNFNDPEGTTRLYPKPNMRPLVGWLKQLAAG